MKESLKEIRERDFWVDSLFWLVALSGIISMGIFLIIGLFDNLSYRTNSL
jgi:hypothetical protein